VRLGGFWGFGEEPVFGVVCWVFAAYTLAPFYLAGWGGDRSSSVCVVYLHVIRIGYGRARCGRGMKPMTAWTLQTL
jgi:hypothetical protein